ncbi:AfsR/SARP family transcriptional regulator [Sphaerisporangium sp. B11E5]|uniref:AfsR/SARP family transcriptional regulator n=1 Tax=Sphaerisporangium sp. B11E5 TaxID=3153563 RepID=UPI00325D4185
MLGNLEVRFAARRIPVTAPKQRVVLATLLLDANNEVPSDHLIRYIWDGRPPAAAQTTLQSYVYRLRRSLRPVRGVELQTGSDGYVLSVDPGALDLEVFRQRAAEGRDLVKDSLGAAVEALRGALAIWRGNALSGIPGELVRQEARFLEGERIAVYEELFNAEIELGNHRQIIPELQKLVSANPFHELLRAQLMLVLYRSGRQADALHNYAVLRRRLHDELGIEPGPDLRELQKAILGQVPSTRIMLPH